MNMTVHQAGLEAAAIQADDFAKDAAVYKTLLESTRAIPWKIDWATMHFAYIGPQIERLLGWSRDSWQSVEDWASRMHEEDREYVVDFCVSQSQAGVDHEADYRALTADGSYVWIRDVVHVVRKDDGEVDCLIGFMFDISERKKSEEELLRLQRELERLSLTDGLTGIANRRLFDKRLGEEFNRATRSSAPLSILLLDLDFFKQYNDHYGHIGGDECLRAVAGALAEVASRSGDLVARFGGEEFAMLLPNTDAEGAQQVAEDCASAIAALAMPHEGSQAGEMVTASIGSITATCHKDGGMMDLIEAADRLLYTAKNNGRARIEAAAI